MESTNNFALKVYEGTDLFNPLTTENENTVAIDEQMFKNQNAGIQTATELVSGTVHAITRSVPDASVFRFTAVSRFTAGDTFTVDDIQVSALTTSGEQIPDGAFIIGSEVIGVLKGTLLTLYISMTKANTAKDADKLGGQLPEYYGSAADVSQAQETATAAGTLSTQNSQAISVINTKLGNFKFVEGHSVYNGYSFNMAGDYAKRVNIVNIYSDGGLCKAVVLFVWDGTQMTQHDIFNIWSTYGGGTISVAGATVTISTVYGAYAEWYVM